MCGQASLTGQHALAQRPQLLDDALAFGLIPSVNDGALFGRFHFFAFRLHRRRRLPFQQRVGLLLENAYSLAHVNSEICQQDVTLITQQAIDLSLA